MEQTEKSGGLSSRCRTRFSKGALVILVIVSNAIGITGDRAGAQTVAAKTELFAAGTADRVSASNGSEGTASLLAYKTDGGMIRTIVIVCGRDQILSSPVPYAKATLPCQVFSSESAAAQIVPSPSGDTVDVSAHLDGLGSISVTLVTLGRQLGRGLCLHEAASTAYIAEAKDVYEGALRGDLGRWHIERPGCGAWARDALVEWTVANSVSLGDQGCFAIDATPGGNRDIFTMKPDASSLTAVGSNLGSDSAPAWSPDGSRIAFVSDRDGNAELYSMKSDGTDVFRLSYMASDIQKLSWRPQNCS